jgi:2-keto-4-pentenoate hydratase/2-oxohepta-3-ene-1,7-dioic acid hydratase in catechol pathway
LAAEALPEALQALQGRAPDVALNEVTFLPVIPHPGKIWCCGLNYGEHVREVGREPPEKPMFFLRFADSQVGHDQPIVLPAESTQLDYEGEIAVVIGKPGRRISEADSWNHIAGYACYNDATLRDWQRHTQQWAPGKNFWHTGGFGPWLTTSDEIAPNELMTLTTRLNGKVMQHATTAMMLHSIPRQIAYASTVSPLRAGDVIVTGTPGGVGARREPPIWMKAGDVIEVEIDKVGILRNRIAAEI